MKDAAVETGDAGMSREDAVTDAIDNYIKAKKRVAFAGLPPPDVFLGLKFSDKGDASTQVP